MLFLSELYSGINSDVISFHNFYEMLVKKDFVVLNLFLSPHNWRSASERTEFIFHLMQVNSVPFSLL